LSWFNDENDDDRDDNDDDNDNSDDRNDDNHNSDDDNMIIVMMIYLILPAICAMSEWKNVLFALHN